MRIEGDVKNLQEIEKVIKAQAGCQVVKDYLVNPPCANAVPSTWFTRKYRLYIAGGAFDITLLFDTRSGRGRFDLRDENSQLVFVHIPQIARMLSKMDKMIFRRRENGEVKTVAINIKRAE